MGGRSPANKPYTSATTTFGSGVVKKQCQIRDGNNDRGFLGLNTFIPVRNYFGYGGGVEGGSIKHGYDGTGGVIYLRRISDTWNSSTTCPTTTICPNEPSGNRMGCMWTS